VDDGSTNKQYPSHDTVDLVNESPISQSNRSHTVPRSGTSQNQHEQQRYSGSFGTPKEYNDIERSVRSNPTRKPRSSSGSSSNPGGRGTGDDILRNQKKTRAARFPVQTAFEDSSDLIDDVVEIQPPTKNPKIQVQIPYQGTANRHPPRPKQDGKSQALTTYPAETSRYFPRKNGNYHGQRELRTSRPSDEDEAWDDQALGEMRPPKRSSKSKNARDSSSDAPYEDEVSLDPLADGHYVGPKENARDLLAKRNNVATHQDTKDQSNVRIEVFDESDDEISSKTKDIQPQKFLQKSKTHSTGNKKQNGNTSKKPNQPKSTAIDRYDVVQLFSESKHYLVPPSDRVWSMNHEHSQRYLRINDETPTYVIDIMASTIRKIEANEDCSKMIIHRSANMSSGAHESKYYLEFTDPGQVENFHEQLRKVEKSIQFSKKEIHYLESSFLNARNRRPEPKHKKSLPVEDADDLKLLREREKRKFDRMADAVQQSKERERPGSRISNANFVDDKKTQRAGGLSKRMRTSATQDKLAMEISDEEGGLSKNFKMPLEILGGQFYGSDKAGDYSLEETSHETRSSTRSKYNPSHQPPPRPRSPSPVLGWTQLNPDWGDSWHGSVVFAGDGKARATIDKTDIPKLDEGEFLNDSLIYFYLLYLQKQLADAQPDLAKRIFVHNSFFYERLTKQSNGRKGFNYEAVRKWTDRANVDIFEKDYIIVPVNENLHWYVAIICNAPKLLNPAVEIEGTPSQGINERSEAQEPKDDPATVPLPPSSPLPVSGIVHLSLDDVLVEENGDKLRSDENFGSSSTKKPSLKPSEDISDADRLDEHNSGDEIELVKSDLIEVPVKAAPKRKGKRASLPRKYDPTEPRIITLDSFGHPHSPACKNLKEYLIEELRAKHHKEIPPPGNLGMTAKGIPLQDNYCDCGVFLLGYMERFFTDPDDFARGLLQGQQDLTSDEKEWVKAPEMRKSIRELLFKLQKEQVPVPTKKGEQKKRKRAPTLDNKLESAVSSKPNSREASKSARASVSPDDNELKGIQYGMPSSASKEPAQKHRPLAIPEDTKPARIESFLPENSASEKSKKAVAAVAPQRTKTHLKDVIPDSEAEDTEPPARRSLTPVKHTPKRDARPTETSREGQSSSLVGRIWTNLWGKDKEEETIMPSNSGASNSNPLQIDESPQKQDQQTKKVAQAPATPASKSAATKVDGSRPTSRESSPFPNFSQDTPPSQPDDDINSDGIFDIPSSPGLEEPIANGSDSRTLADEDIKGSREINHEDQEMLLTATANSSKQRYSETSSKQSSSKLVSRSHNSKKRSRSEAPGHREKRPREETSAVNEGVIIPDDSGLEKRQLETSRVVSHGPEQRNGDHDSKPASKKPHTGLPLSQGKHIKFRD